MAAPGAQRYRLDIGYAGTTVSGWALAPHRRAVGGTLSDALGLLLRQPVQLTVAGRTDAGVHATGQVAHVDPPSSTDPGEVLRKLARLLPADVRVRAVSAVPAEFDARFSALRRH